jgi:hypothetical protein
LYGIVGKDLVTAAISPSLENDKMALSTVFFVFGGTTLSKLNNIQKIRSSFIPNKSNINVAIDSLNTAKLNNLAAIKAGSLTAKELNIAKNNLKNIAIEIKGLKSILKNNDVIKSQTFNKPNEDARNLIKFTEEVKKIYHVTEAPISAITKGGVLEVLPGEMGAGRAIYGENYFYTDVQAAMGYAKGLNKSKFADKLLKYPGIKSMSSASKKKLQDRINTLFNFFKNAPKAKIIVFNKIKFDIFPKSYQLEITKASKGLLSVKKQKALRIKLNTYIKNNIDKFFPGPRTSALGIGESEFVAPVGSKFYTKKNLRTKLAKIFGGRIGNKFTINPETKEFIEVVDLFPTKDRTSAYKSIKEVLTEYKKLYGNWNSAYKTLKLRFSKSDVTKIKRIKKLAESGNTIKTKTMKDYLKFIIEKIKKSLPTNVELTKKIKAKSKTKKKSKVKVAKKEKKMSLKQKKKLKKKLDELNRRKSTNIRQTKKRIKDILRDTPIRDLKKRKTSDRTTPRITKTSRTAKIRTPKVRKIARTPTVRKPTIRKPTIRTPTVRKPIIRITRTPTIRTPTKPTPVKPTKKIRITTDLPKSKTKKVPGYIVKIKKGNRIIAKSEKVLPKNRAKNLARKLTDNTIGASHTITAVKKTNIIDVKTKILGKKFRPKKSKNPKVLKEVEKRKYRLDKAKEKLDIKLSKKYKVKAKSKTKTRKSIKVSTKNKNHSNIKRNKSKR